MKNRILLTCTCAVAAIAALTLFRPPTDTDANAAPPVSSSNTAMVQINLPPMEGNAAIGRKIFENTCAVCHGPSGVGNSEAGPPLIHKLYEPSHHGDESFQRAAARGVPAHHWRFGNMPPIEGLTRADVAMITEYIREIQRANNIE